MKKKGMLGFVVSLSTILMSVIPSCRAEEWVRWPQGITAEMSSAAYWMTEDDTLLMTREQIQRVNSIADYLRMDGLTLQTLPDAIPADLIRKLLGEIKVPDNTGWIDGQSVSPDYWQKMIDAAAYDALPEQLPVRYGFSVRRGSLRLYPTDQFIGESETDRFYDLMVCSEFLPFQPLAVIHESRDGEWIFVIMYGYAGWVRKTDAALCDTKEEWLKRQNPEHFLIVTGRELQLEEDPYIPEISGLTVPMGTKLPLSPRQDEPVNGRIGLGAYVVSLPVRDEDGGLREVQALIPCSSDVHVGTLEMTSNQIIAQAFKWLGNNYGWAGLHRAQDCSGIVRDVLRCFGLELGRGARMQSVTPGLKTIDLESMSPEEKEQQLNQLTPGSLLFFPGHITIWLGQDTVLSAVGSFADGREQSVQNYATVLLNNVKSTYRRNGLSWLESFTRAVLLEAE